MNNNQNDSSTPPKNNGGLYSKVNVSLKTMNIVIAAAIAVLVLCTIFLVSHGGFTVRFDTDGGSYVESQKLKYGEHIVPPDDPVKEGWSFDGWYTDRGCTESWDMESSTVQDSMTLYAGWEKK